MNTRFRLALLAALTLAGTSRHAGADPGSHTAPATASREPELNYVYFMDDNHTSMSGSTKDIEIARRFKQAKEPVLWFRDGGQEYVVRDPAVLKQIEATWKPVVELGEAQGKLGTQQGELGTQQGELGSQQGVLGARQGTLAVRESALDLRDNTGSLSDAERTELTRQRHELRRQQRTLDKQMRALDRPMRELGEKMEVLGREMEALGRKMEAASHKAEAELRALLRRAIASGAAKPAR